MKEEIEVAFGRFVEQKWRDPPQIAAAWLAALESVTAETKKAASTPKKKRGPKVVTRPLLRTTGGREGAAFSEFWVANEVTVPASKVQGIPESQSGGQETGQQGKQYVPLLHEACCQS
jgi:hypothetical protein